MKQTPTMLRLKIDTSSWNKEFDNLENMLEFLAQNNNFNHPQR